MSNYGMFKFNHVKMMLFIGIKTNFITYPTTPMTANPKAHA